LVFIFQTLLPLLAFDPNPATGFNCLPLPPTTDVDVESTAAAKQREPVL
jgi:hypothetical protein